MVTAITGLFAAAVTAVLLSRWFPVGLAGRLEPDRGISADWLVIGPGAAGVAILALVATMAAALRATAAGQRRTIVAPRSRLASALGRVAPLPTVIGAGLALRRGEGKRALPVRPAIASGVAAVLGVVGGFGLLHGIDDALVSPERAGQIWDAELVGNQIDNPAPGVPPELEAEEAVAELATLDRINVEFEGAAGVPIYTLNPVRGVWAFTLLQGRNPVAVDDVVIGPATAKALGVAVGDTMRTADGRELRIVGLGLLPQTPHFSFDQGAWVSAQGFDTLALARDGESQRDETVLVRFRKGASQKEAVAGLEERFGPRFDVETSGVPQDVEYLRNVRPLPRAFAAFLVLLGVGTLGQVLTSTVRRRRHDLSVLRALGFRPLQVAGCVSWQAITVSLIALVIGIPLGIAAGRWSWRWVADSIPLFYAPPLAASVAVLSVPAALLLANAMAALPARRAARLRPADVLRAE